MPPDRELEVIDELAGHLETRYNDLRAAGASDDEATRRTLEHLHPDVLAAELGRALQAPPPLPRLGEPEPRGSFLDNRWQDLKLGVRLLRKYPGFTAVAALTLALGIGATTAIFTVANTVLLRPLPFPDPDGLVRLFESNPSRGWPSFGLSHPNFLDWRERNRAFEQLAAWSGRSLNLTGLGDSELLQGTSVTPEFLPALRALPVLGRNFSAEEDRPGGPHVAIVSDRFYRTRLGGDPAGLGRTLTLDDEPYTVVGVLPAWFDWSESQILVPLQPDPSRGRGDHRLRAIARLRPGLTVADGRAEIVRVAAELAAAYPDTNAEWTAGVESFFDWQVPEPARRSVFVFFAAAGLVLLIACSNVANLFLARAAARRREIAIRLALGARRRRILGQLATEAVLLALLAGVLGFLLAAGVTDLIKANAQSLPRREELSLDLTVLAFAVGVTFLAAILFALAPALQASRPDPSAALREGGRGGSGRHRLRSLLVVVQVGLSVTLLAGAGLLLRSFRAVQHTDPGFHTHKLLSLRVHLRPTRYPTGAEAADFYRRLLPELSALPGVTAAATASLVPLGSGNTATDLVVDGRPPEPGGALPSADWRIVSPGYFAALGARLRGRDFTAADDADAPRVTIVSEELARRAWPGEDPIGKRLTIKSFGGKSALVVGVAGDVKSTLDAGPRPILYVSLWSAPTWRPQFLVVRTALDARSQAVAARDLLRRLDPGIPAYPADDFDTLLERSLSPRRFDTVLVGLLAAVALALACVGLFGVLSQLVVQRIHEIGIRLALGAQPRSVFGLILGRGLLLAGAGAAAGLLGAVWVAGALEPLLYEVPAHDPLTYAGVIGLLLVVAALACALPARRAMRVDPMEALRDEV